MIPVSPRAWWRRAGIGLIWVVVALLVWFVFRQIPFTEILAVISRLGPESVLVLIAVNLGFLILANLRWLVLLRSFGYKISLVSLMGYRLAGFGLSYITPGPQFGGEPLQVYLLRRRAGVQLETAISSVYLDRLIDLMANFTFLFIGSIVIVSSDLFVDWINDSVWIIALSLLALPAAHLILLFLGKRPVSWLVSKLSWQWIRKIRFIGIRSEEQVANLVRTKPTTLAWMIVLSGLLWSGAIVEFWLCLHFLGVNASLQDTIGALTAARLALFVPVPGGLGALETSQFLAASWLGWGAVTGIALSLVIRARDIILACFGLVLGFGYNHPLLNHKTDQGKEYCDAS